MGEEEVTTFERGHAAWAYAEKVLPRKCPYQGRRKKIDETLMIDFGRAQDELEALRRRYSKKKQKETGE